MPSLTLSLVLDEMVAHDVVRRSNLVPNGRVFLISKSGRAVVICDLRWANSVFPPPPRSPLPSRADVLSALRWAGSDGAICHVDVARCFDSIILPKTLRNDFTFAVSGVTFTYNRLPFGWAWAPWLAQRLLDDCIRSTVAKVCISIRVILYIDDILIFARSHTDAARFVSVLVADLRRIGFVISPKSKLTPSPSVVALGARWDVRTSSVFPLVTVSSLRELRSCILRARFRRSDLLRLVGSLLWWSPLALPFLGPVFAEISHGPVNVRVRRRIVIPLLRAIEVVHLTVRRGSYGGSQWAAVSAPISVPTDRLCFVDAAAALGRVGYVSERGYASRRLPAWLFSSSSHTDQQLAELFACVVATKRAVRAGVPTVVVSDSASSLSSVLRLSAPVSSPSRALLLRRLAYARARWPQHHVLFAFMRGVDNPADAPSRGRGAGPLASSYRVLPVPGLPPVSCLRRPGVIRYDPRRVVSFSRSFSQQCCDP